MNRTTSRFVAAFSLFLMLGLPAMARQDSTTKVGSFSDLTLALSTPKTTYVRAEPIPLSISLTNRTSQSITGHSAIGFRAHRVRLYVTSQGQSKKIETLTDRHSLTEVSPVTMPPGKSFDVQELLYIDLEKSFSEPGSYEIQAVLSDAEGHHETRSAPLTITMGEPEGVDLAAYEFLKKQGRLSRLFNDTTKRPTRIELQRFVTEFADSSYGDYARIVLGVEYSLDGEQKKAIEQLTVVAKKTNSSFAREAAEYLKKANDGGRSASAIGVNP